MVTHPLDDETPVTLTLGEWRVLTPMGRGATGVVWRARHSRLGVPAAVKVIRQLSDPRMAEAIRGEVRANAALNHPAILQIYDQGVVTPAEERASTGRFRHSHPWMVMELASDGPVKSGTSVSSWHGLQDTLVVLLGALAHAHARGVIHRDIKPSNLLLSGPGDLRPGVKLADFGIATAGISTGERRVIGTPPYMAPEQYRGDPRDLGPWTDLYALACTTWELVTGATPFPDAAPERLALSHLYEEPPALRPFMSVPDDLEAWLRRLLSKDPASRYSCAADAAWALSGLGPARMPGGAPTRRAAWRPADTVDLPSPDSGPLTLADLILPDVGPPEDSAQTHRVMPDVLPPIPETWRTREPPPSLPPTLSAAPSLYAVRGAHIVGRDTERDELWSTLVRAHRTGQPGIVALRGPVGVGRSSLARWLGERAQETGAGVVLRVTQARRPTPGDGPGPAFARWLRLVGLPWDQALSRAARFLRRNDVRDPADAASVAALAGDEEAAGGWGTGERFALYQRLCEIIAPDRPLVICIEGDHVGAETAAWLTWMLGQIDVQPFVAVVPCSDDEPSLEVAPLLSHPATRIVDVQPLDPADARAMLDGLLGLDEELATEVALRSAGNPMYIVQIVADWIERDVLVAGPAGLTVPPMEWATLASDVPSISALRVERLLVRRPGWWRACLEVAAALGEYVDPPELDAACRAGGLPSPGELAERLLHDRLAVAADTGWHFAHPLVRDVIEAGAREAGTWESANRACATMLRRRRDHPGRTGRIGRHLVQAGLLDEGLDALIEQARRHLLKDEARLAADIVDEAWIAAQEGELDAAAARWWVLRLLRARIHKARHDLDAAWLLACGVEEAAVDHGWTRLEAEAAAEQADIDRMRGDLSSALQRFRQVLVRYRALDDDQGIADTMRSLSAVALHKGDAVIAWQMLQDSRRRYDELGDRFGAAMCLAGLGDIARVRGRWDEALNRYRAALAALGGLRHRSGIAMSLHGLAEVQRLTGNLDAAEDGYRQVIRLDTQLGRDNSVSRLNLAFCLIERDDDAQAIPALEELEATWHRQGRPGYTAIVQVAWLPVLAARGEIDAFQAHLDSAVSLLKSCGLVEVDVARMAELAGDRAMAGGHAGEAGAAWALAEEQYGALGASGAAARVAGKRRGAEPALSTT